MKLLMFYAHEFWFKTTHKGLTPPWTWTATNGFKRLWWFSSTPKQEMRAEARDEDRTSKVLTKMVKNIKWLAGKFGSKNVVLHSFSHLSTSRASPDFAQQILVDAQKRLQAVGFTTHATTFGYLHEFSLHVSGESLGRVFKDI